MIYSIKGKVVFSDTQSIAVETAGGVTFRLFVSANTLKMASKVGEQINVFTYLSVREDAMDLYGFYDIKERQYFEMLINVNGVGPKAALSVLSSFSPDSLAICIASGDTKSITSAQGVGQKIAQRIVLELKDKMAKLAPSEINSASLSNGISGVSGNKSEAVSALAALGFSSNKALSAISDADSALSVEELIKLGLKNLSKGL